MSCLLENVTNSIWHAFNALATDKSGNVIKSKLKVLTANIGTLLDLYGVEKGLDHYRSTPTLHFQHYKYYLSKEVSPINYDANGQQALFECFAQRWFSKKRDYIKVFSSLPECLPPPVLRKFEGRIDEVCWLICKKDFVSRTSPVLSDDSTYRLFRVFCLLADLVPDAKLKDVYQVVMHSSEVQLVAAQLVGSLGLEWDGRSFEALSQKANGFRFSTMLTVLETKYLNGVEPYVLDEAVTDLSHTFVDDVIKKGCLLKRGYLLPTMREYWFVLQPSQLTYHKGRGEQQQCGAISLDPRCWVDSPPSPTHHRILLHTSERCFELAAHDHRSRVQWCSALQLAISQSLSSSSSSSSSSGHKGSGGGGGGVGYQRQLAIERRRKREDEASERRRRSEEARDMAGRLRAERLARAAAELEAREAIQEQERRIQELGDLLKEETQAKRDEEIVRTLQARVLREEWSKREELEQLQEEQRALLEQEREKRMEFERRQKENERQLEEAERRLKELEAERQRLGVELELHRARGSASPTKNGQVKVRRTMSFIPTTRDSAAANSRPSPLD